MLNEAVALAIQDEIERVAQEEAEFRNKIEDDDKFVDTDVPPLETVEDTLETTSEAHEDAKSEHDLSDHEKEEIPYEVDKEFSPEVNNSII